MGYNITLNEVKDVLGEPSRYDEKYAFWKCPECNDSGSDNVTFNFVDRLLWSWCCDAHKRIFGQIMANRGNNFINKRMITPEDIVPVPKITRNQIEGNKEYYNKCHNHLAKNQKHFEILEKQRGLRQDWVFYTCGIGLDPDTDEWVFPVFDMNLPPYSISGFEYRKLDLTPYGNGRKLRHQTGTYSCLSELFRQQTKHTALIMEGFMDAYVMGQYIYDQAKSKDYHILTPSCGVHSVVNLLKTFEFLPYSRVIVYLDNDPPGLKTAQEVARLFPQIEIITMTCGCGDFNEHYMKCIKGG